VRWNLGGAPGVAGGASLGIYIGPRRRRPVTGGDSAVTGRNSAVIGGNSVVTGGNSVGTVGNGLEAFILIHRPHRDTAFRMASSEKGTSNLT
jgi:hypothetical protein